MARGRGEQRFEYRIQRILESKGYLVINCARSKPFDLIAIKDGFPILIEIKGKNTSYPKKQFEEQCRLCKETGNEFVIVKQSKKRGKIHIEPGWSPSIINTAASYIEEELQELF